MFTATDRLVLGSWGLAASSGGRNGYAEIGARMAEAVLAEAWSLGIRMIDTAPAYGAGEALRRVHAWQDRTGRRYAPVLKPGRPLVGGKPVARLAYSQICTEIKECVALLGSPAAVLIKDPPLDFMLSDALREYWQALLADYPESLVGVATHRIEPSLAPPDRGRAESLAGSELGSAAKGVMQLEYNGVNWPLAAPAAAHFRARGWRVWSMQPLAYGFLAGRDIRSEFPAEDFRAHLPTQVRAALCQAAAIFMAALAPSCPGASPAVVALAFCLCDPSIERVVVGPKSVEQVAEVGAALELAANSDFQAAANGLRRAI